MKGDKIYREFAADNARMMRWGFSMARQHKDNAYFLKYAQYHAKRYAYWKMRSVEFILQQREI